MSENTSKFKTIFSLLTTGFIISFLIFPKVAFSQEMNNLMVNLITPTPIVRAELIGLVFKIIRYLLGFLGVVAVIILIYGGFLWMTAKGDEERVRKAKKTIINGLIGLIIILLSYAIVSFVGIKIKEIAEERPACTPGECCANCYRCSADGSACNVWDSSCGSCSPSLGQRFDVVWTYPENGNENISLCALIQAGFNADLDASSVNSETVKIFIRDGKDAGEECRENKECKSDKCENGVCQGNTIDGEFTVVKNVFKFSHPDFEKETWYRVIITQRVRNKDGIYLSAQRTIDFETGTEEDKTPPTVEETYPEKDQENVCLLDPIQALFSEPMDVTTLLKEENFYTDPSHQFSRSVPNIKTFNASPEKPYQSKSTYTATLKDNITDVCGNKLDGDNNGEPGGDYSWSFKTGNTLYCDPIIESLNPSSGFYNDEITISGNYFKLNGNVVFNQNIFVNHLCFDENKFPRYPCLVSWRNNEIKVKVPAAGGSSEGAVSGPVYVIVGSRFSNFKNFTLLSPYISSFTPTSGGRGQAITIRGQRFGNSSGKVYFIKENTLERYEGNLICGDAGWKENEIVVAVPDIPLGNYYLQIEREDGKYSNIRSQTFEVNNQEPGPVLCDITPYCEGTNLRGGKKDDEKTLSGDKFGTNQGKVLFDSTEARIKSWTNKEIKISVPDISPGTYQVKVVDSNGKLSNPLSFVSPCLPRGGFGSACFLDPNTCTNERCLSPYQCVSGSDGSFECRCCCTVEGGCPGSLECDPTQICYKNRSSGTEVYGVCCGCQNSNDCSENEICKSKNNGPNCCYACEIGDETRNCNGGQCCSEDCSKFNQNECQRYEGCSWVNGKCQGRYAFCCHGECVRINGNYECRGLCGNGRIDPGEECDPGDPNRNIPEDLGGKTCQDLGFEGGELHCLSECKFDTSGCFGAQSGNWGDVCRNTDLNCPYGKSNCALAKGATCVKNNPDAPCACCCDKDANPDTCKELGEKLFCNEDLPCGGIPNHSQKGLCCGCEKDEDCHNGIGFACKNKCCYPFPPPKELKVTVANVNEIVLNWEYEDVNQLATHFEIYGKGPGEDEFNLLTTCEIESYSCDNQNFILEKGPSPNSYKFTDKRGNFERGETYSYKIRAKKGTQTAYSDWAGPVGGKIVGVISCQENSDCPDEAPCCRKDKGICVNWENCENQCQPDDRCKGPEKKFATADFWVTQDKVVGPCLIKIVPNNGYSCGPEEKPPFTSVTLSGYNFGTRGEPDGVYFNGKIGGEFEEIKEACEGCNYCQYFSWGDKEIKIERTPPWEAKTGLVKVKKIIDGKIFWSNGLKFTVKERLSGAGQECKKDVEGCPVGGICQPQDIYSCLECNCSQYSKENCLPPYCQWIGNENRCENVICENINDKKTCQNYSHCRWDEIKSECFTYSSHCRCCCDPNLSSDPCKNLNQRLACYPNQDPCTGNNRGLCCGCQNDSDCNLSGSNVNGCGMKEKDPKCCYPRPKLISVSFCDDIGPNDVRLNTAITLNFSEKMDFESLNNENIKVSRGGNCTSTNEGETINNRCYLYGIITNENKGGKTQTIFQPKLCKLQPNTTYKIEIVVGENGNGVRSEKGVSMNFAEDKCSWDKNKNCQVEEFTTSNDLNALCKIEWIDVQPRGPVIVRDTNIAVNYKGFARDSKNNPVCVENFVWESSNPNVAVVTTPGLETTATSKGVGEAKIIAKIPVLNKTCDTLPNHTCGLLKVTLAGPQVIEKQSCDVCQLGGQSPSPWKFSPDACLKAQIVARFDKVMNSQTLNLENIKVRDCLTDDFNNLQNCNNGSDIDGRITVAIDQKGFYFKPLNDLRPNNIYRVTLKSGTTGIKDKNGLELDGNKNGIQDGSPADDYVWYFKTSNTLDCPLNKVCLNPPQAKINHPGNQEFKAEVYTANCNYLEAKDFTWNWERVKIEPWNPDKVATLTPNNEKATANSVGLGEVYVKASTQGKSDQARLTVATVPIIEKTYPTGNNLCRNVSIWALFDQEMDGKTLNSSNIFFEKCKKTGGVTWGQPGQPGEECREWVDIPFRISWQKIERKTKVILTPDNFLEKSTLYKVTIKKEVKSAPPFEREMEKDYSWTFTTSSYICFLEKVEVEPPSHLFTKAKDKKPFTARAFYRETEIQPIPDLYEWEWNWQSTDESIVKVAQDNENPNLADAESQSKNGIVNIIAKATITVDKIFIPSTVGQFKEGSSRVEVWLCENPWPSTKFPEGETYEDKTTNFEFRYCRDAGPNGLEGDLPILKGGKITGPVEPGLQKLTEHFFTVYDGSLSFFYDGEEILALINPPKSIVPNRSGYNNPSYTIFGNNNGEINGEIEKAEGKFGNALNFDGNSSLKVNLFDVPYGRNLTLEPEKFSLEAWVMPKKFQTPSGSIFRKGFESGGYGLELNQGKVRFWLVDKKGQLAEISTEEPISSYPNWTHLVATYDGKELKLYINGQLKGQTSTINGGITQSDSDLFIGEGFSGYLDEIALWQKVLTENEIDKHIKNPISPTLGDVIGFKVFSDFEHLKPDEWYKKYAPGETASGSYSLVDGYKAYQVGRTIYVSATNVDLSLLTNPKIYTNIYLVSQSDNPKSETSQVFRNIVNNWRFNTNKDNEGKYLISLEEKGKLRNDLERIWHIKTVWQTLERYREINKKEENQYPRLKSGTYIIGMSTSKWPSWTGKTGLGQDLVSAGLSPLPVDPINKFETRDDCGDRPSLYSCCANCPRKDPKCADTCYNPVTSVYEAIPGSQIYQYMAEEYEGGSAYSFYLNFEYNLPDFWQHGCSNLTQSECLERAFCRWEKRVPTGEAGGAVPGECEARRLNYSGDPCSSPSTCPVFNARFSNWWTAPPQPPEIISFTANPSQVNPNEQTTLSWQTRNAERCVASAEPENENWQGEVDLSGSKSVTLSESTTFHLTCYKGELSTSASVYVSVIQQFYTLNVYKASNGSGTVTGPGIDCGTDCSESYNQGTQVTLTATPASGSTFTGWSGDCSGTQLTCTLTMNSNKSVTANFSLLPLPSVTTLDATNITSNEAILNGTANPNGLTTTAWFRYSESNPGSCNDNFGTRVPASGGVSLGNGNSPVSFSQIAINLSPGTTYYFCAIAQNSAGKSFGNLLSFTTYPYSGYAYVANNGKHNVLKVNINNFIVEKTIYLPEGYYDDPFAVCLTPDKRYVFVTDEDTTSPDIYKIDTQNNDQVSTFVNNVCNGSRPVDCAVTPDGQYLFVLCAGTYNGIEKYNMSGEKKSSWSLAYDPKHIVISPYNDKAYISAAYPNNIYILNLSNNFLYTRSANIGEIDGLALSRDGKYLYITSDDNIGIFDTSSESLITAVENDNCKSIKDAIYVAPNNQFLFVGSTSPFEQICKWNIQESNLTLSCRSATTNEVRRGGLAITDDNSDVIVSESGAGTDAIERFDQNCGKKNSITSDLEEPYGLRIK
jgi:hypothetical protein